MSKFWNFEQINKEIERIRAKQDYYRDKADALEENVETLARALQKVCSHLNATVVPMSWSEPKFETSYWDELHCDDCGKVLAVRQEVTTTSEWKFSDD